MDKSAASWTFRKLRDFSGSARTFPSSKACGIRSNGGRAMMVRLNRLERAALAFAALLPVLILGIILFYRPFWGLMDDAVNIFHARAMKQTAFFPYWWSESL